MTRICVNVLSVINSASNITSEVIDGAEHIVVKDVCPVVDDIVLNGGLYPAAEIAKGFKSLEGKPMPYGHPKIDGQYVSASNVRAVNEYHIGAFARNVRKDGDRVKMDMCVNRRYAEATEKGKEVVSRLDAMKIGKDVKPVGVSTGLGLNKLAANGVSKGKKYSWIATNQDYDHCAILLHETPAGTPDEGVGIFVNAAGDELEIESVNLSDSETPDPQDPLLNQLFNKMAAFFSANANTKKEELDPMKELITNALKAKGIPTEGKSDAELMSAYNKSVADDAAKKEETPEEKAAREKKEAEDKATKDKETTTAVNADEAPAWFKPFANELAAVRSGLTANADKEKSAMRSALKAKFGMSDIAVNALEGEPLKELYAQCATSHGLSGAFNHSTDTKSISEMPE